MHLYHYISLDSFVGGCQSYNLKEAAFTLRLPNLFHALLEDAYLAGLSLLREAIGRYEILKGIDSESSKMAVPFFRENRLKLVGPDMDLFMISLYANTTLPSALPATSTGKPVLRLAFDYQALVEHCLSENFFLIRCKYEEEPVVETFTRQMEREYDKFFFDEENSGFTADSHFFSLLCNACLEVMDSSLSGEEEWRIASLCPPSEADYSFIDGQFTPYITIKLPLSCIHNLALLNWEDDPNTFSAFAGFLERIGLAPERYLEGIQE